MKASILIIDDDARLNALLTDYLARFEMTATTATKPSDGFRLLRSRTFDAIILDVMLPEQDGFEVCKKLRSEFQVPIIMLTARGEVTDKVVGLELGADDYMPKPFEPRELVARLQAILRRSQNLDRKSMLVSGPLNIDASSQAVSYNGADVLCTTMEFDALYFLVSHRGRVVTREMLLENLKGDSFEAFNRSVDILVSRLRQKLKSSGAEHELIKTILGKGYMFIDEN